MRNEIEALRKELEQETKKEEELREKEKKIDYQLRLQLQAEVENKRRRNEETNKRIAQKEDQIRRSWANLTYASSEEGSDTEPEQLVKRKSRPASSRKKTLTRESPISVTDHVRFSSDEENTTINAVPIASDNIKEMTIRIPKARSSSPKPSTSRQLPEEKRETSPSTSTVEEPKQQRTIGKLRIVKEKLLRRPIVVIRRSPMVEQMAKRKRSETNTTTQCDQRSRRQVRKDEKDMRFIGKETKHRLHHHARTAFRHKVQETWRRKRLQGDERPIISDSDTEPQPNLTTAHDNEDDGNIKTPSDLELSSDGSEMQQHAAAREGEGATQGSPSMLNPSTIWVVAGAEADNLTQPSPNDNPT